MTTTNILYRILTINGGSSSPSFALLEQTSGSGETGIPRDGLGRSPQRIQKLVGAPEDSNDANSHK